MTIGRAAIPLRDADPLLSMSQAQVNSFCEGLPTEYAERACTIPIEAPGALQQWRAELECGARTRLTADPLFYAACAELNAREAEAAGVPRAADAYRRQSVSIILDAVAAKHAA